MSWFEEAIHVPQGYAQRFEVSRELVRERTDFQDLVIFDNPLFGRVLALDGVIQTTERDEHAYHEMLAHVPMFAHGRARRVLIVGGGDGGVLREVLRHPVDKVTMVEIDRLVVERCREFLPGLNAGAFDDPRAEVLIDDGIRYAADSREAFDVIIVDSTDPIGPGEVLFTEAFYIDCKRLLGSTGVLVTQCGVPVVQGREVTDTAARLRPHFADVGFFLTAVPTYVGGFMTLGWATDDPGLRGVHESDLAERYAANGLQTRYYSPAVHRAAFALPPFIEALAHSGG